MLPAFLITFREVIEASLIVVTILGILVKLKQHASIKAVWWATGAASLASLFLVAGGSVLGFEVQELYEGKVEQLTEGILLTVSAVFITWAVFFLHKYFANYKVKLLQKVKSTVETQEKRGIFILVFTAVFREGIEIALFLSSIYFAAKPTEILSGFGIGVIAGILICVALFTATLRLPVYYAFRVTSVLLILFAAGMLARGVHEFAEAGYIPEIHEINFAFLPSSQTIAGNIMNAVFGISKTMNILQLTAYSVYVLVMTWMVFLRHKIRIVIR
jgi:high-affinity iron transporter